MERLTEEYGNYAIIKEINESIKSLIRINDLIPELLKRLAAYEDSGLTPEEVVELAKIVRCKDCRHYVPLKGSEENERFWHGLCRNWRTDDEHIPYTDENGFCKNGENRLEA